MKIAVMGTGGVGGYYGALLALKGHEVTFIARGPHLQAIREKGLAIRSVHGDFIVYPARATDDPTEAGQVELILFATKTYHTDDGAQLVKPMVAETTTVVSFQNGVDAAERIGAVIGMDHLLGGVTWLSAAIEAPGIIGQYSQFRRIALGEFDRQTTARARTIHDVLGSTGATVELVPDITRILWTKFVFIASVSALGCLTRVSFGEYRHVPEARAVLTEAIEEVSAVAKARGIQLDADITEKTLAFIDSSDPGIKPSMQRDVESGRRSELESMIGIVVRLGKEAGIRTPVVELAYSVLKPAELKAQS